MRINYAFGSGRISPELVDAATGEAEASRVAPDWHGWLHHTWDQPPTKAPLDHKPWEKPHQENLTGTLAAYAPPGSIRAGAPVARADYEAWQPE